MSEEQKFGGYTGQSWYKMMMLRQILTGTNAPTEEELSAGLTRLLEHLEKYRLEPK